MSSTSTTATPEVFDLVKLAGRNAVLGDSVSMDERIIPYLIGTSPPVASVGMTEEEARSSGRAVGVHRQEFVNVCSVAKVIGEPEGLIKVVFDADSGELLGAHAFGAGAPELVQELAFAMHARMTLREAASAIVAFPGFSFALVELLKPCPGDPH